MEKFIMAVFCVENLVTLVYKPTAQPRGSLTVVTIKPHIVKEDRHYAKKNYE